jgi:hypothetical protein
MNLRDLMWPAAGVRFEAAHGARFKRYSREIRMSGR